MLNVIEMNMSIYIAILILGAIPLFDNRLGFGSYNKLLWYVIVPLVICFGYMTGTDWRNYEREWDFIIVQSYNPFTDGYEEPGYWVLCYIFKSIGVGFWEFNIALKLVGYYVFVSVYRRYSNDSTWGLMYGFVFWMLNSIMNFPARNFCAWIIFIYAIKYIQEKNLIKYLLLCSLAMCFHISVILAIPIYFLNFDMSKRQMKYSIVVIGIIYIVFSAFKNQILGSFGGMTLLDIGDRVDGYLDTSGRHTAEMGRSSFSFGFLVRFMVYVLAVHNYERICAKYKYGRFILNMSFLVAVCEAIMAIVPISARILACIVILYCVLFSYLMSVLTFNQLLKNVIAFAFLLFFTVGTVANSIYTPYSNYLEYVFKVNKPSYNERFIYNDIHSPYQ